MMREEFEKRTGFYPTSEEYAAIEKAYLDFDGDKDAFCKAYKKNLNGMAERIQRELDVAAFRERRAHEAELAKKDEAADLLKAEIERLKKELEREQEWRDYEDTKSRPNPSSSRTSSSPPTTSPRDYKQEVTQMETKINYAKPETTDRVAKLLEAVRSVPQDKDALMRALAETFISGMKAQERPTASSETRTQ